jgi:hypothetical protein
MPYELGDFGGIYTRSGRIVQRGDIVVHGHRRIV